MKLSKIRENLILLGLFCALLNVASAQNDPMSSILPPDHLLEPAFWMNEDGKIEEGSLLNFENIRDQKDKDLIVIYRQSAPVSELDKPHNQTLIVGFYSAGKYELGLKDEGGPIHWLKLFKIPEKSNPVLVFQRDDLKGNQVLKGFMYEDGKMKQVLAAAAPQVFARFTGASIWCSSRAFPKDEGEAEHQLVWDGAKDAFMEPKVASGGLAGWSGDSIALPKVESNPATVASVVKKPSHPAKNGWWDEPMDSAAASAKLNTELVPDLLKKGQIVVLGQKARAFFDELQKQKTATKDINALRSSYYAAVASTLLDMGNKKDASYYLKTALSFQADNADALAVKAKLQP